MHVAIVLFAVVLALWPSSTSLVNYWRAITDYQHGFLIAPLSLLWLGWLLRRGMATRSQPSAVGLSGLFLLLLIWVVAQRAGFDIVHQAVLPLVMLAAIWAVCGSRVMRSFAPAILLLYFAIPIWDYLLPVLQRLSIFATEHLLALLGVPATVTEYRVTIPEGTFAIIEGCSGKRYLIVTLAVAWLMGWLNDMRGRQFAKYLAICAALALITNWVRIVIVIYAGHVSNMEHYFVAVEHFTLGNIIFLVLLAAVLALGRKFDTVRRAATDVPDEGLLTRTSATPVDLHFVAGRSLWIVLVALALTAAVGRINHGETQSKALGQWPLGTGNWQGPLPSRASWKPDFAAAKHERRAQYLTTNGVLEVYVNLYPSAQSGAELIQYGNNIAAPMGWDKVWNTTNETISGNSDPLSAFVMSSPDGRQWLVAFTYRAASHATHGDIPAKLLIGWLSLFSAIDQGVVALSSPCEPGNCDKARALITDFWENNGSPLLAMIPAKVEPAP
jgi:EpsI family protein